MKWLSTMKSPITLRRLAGQRQLVRPCQTLTRDGIVMTTGRVIHAATAFMAIRQCRALDVYTESQDGYIDRRDMRTGQQRSIRLKRRREEAHYRFQWNSPVAVFCSRTHHCLLRGKLFVQSTDRGDNWVRLGGT